MQNLQQTRWRPIQTPMDRESGCHPMDSSIKGTSLNTLKGFLNNPDATVEIHQPWFLNATATHTIRIPGTRIKPRHLRSSSPILLFGWKSFGFPQKCCFSAQSCFSRKALASPRCIGSSRPALVPTGDRYPGSLLLLSYQVQYLVQYLV